MSNFASPVMSLRCVGFLRIGAEVQPLDVRPRPAKREVGRLEIRRDLAAHEAGLGLHVEVHRQTIDVPSVLTRNVGMQLVARERRHDPADLRQRRPLPSVASLITGVPQVAAR